MADMPCRSSLSSATSPNPFLNCVSSTCNALRISGGLTIHVRRGCRRRRLALQSQPPRHTNKSRSGSHICWVRHGRRADVARLPTSHQKNTPSPSQASSSTSSARASHRGHSYTSTRMRSPSGYPPCATRSPSTASTGPRATLSSSPWSSRSCPRTSTCSGASAGSSSRTSSSTSRASSR